MIDFKTQTKRSTKFNVGIININLFCKGFEFGIVTSKYWGDFDERGEQLIEIEIEGIPYRINLSDFIKKIKPILKNHKA